MRTSTTGKILAALLLSALMGLYIHHDYVRWNQRGKEAFLAYHAHRFDRDVATPRPIGPTILGTTMIVVVFCGAYELLALGFSALARPRMPAAGESPPQYPHGGSAGP